MSAIQKSSVSPSTKGPVSDDTILKIAKEIAVKFIEVGRITPATFDDSFRNIYTTIETTVRSEK